MERLKKINRGFTLVELSIVLVIIGLLIGGILVAQSMIGTAKVQAQIRQFQQMDIAITNFKNTLKVIPGDCRACATDSMMDSNGKLTDWNNVTPPAISYRKSYIFFTNLYEMGHWNDMQSGASMRVEFGVGKEYPAAAIGRGGIVMSGNNAGDLYYNFMYQGNNAGDTSFNTILAQGSLSPSEALAIDTKLDDGNATTGNVAATTATAAANGSTGLPFTLSAQGASLCVNSGNYNVSLTATNLCRLAVKANYY